MLLQQTLGRRIRCCLHYIPAIGRKGEVVTSRILPQSPENGADKSPAILPEICAHAGSPLGLFLALRKVDPKKSRGLGTRAAAGLMLGAQASQPGCGDGLPAVHRMYNLYHPFDPVGYRCHTHQLTQWSEQSLSGSPPQLTTMPKNCSKMACRTCFVC